LAPRSRKQNGRINRRTFLKGAATTAGVVGAVLTNAAAAQDATASKDNTVETRITFQRSIPLRHSVDVFVAGGGPSGIAAAVAAARQGQRVFLAERLNCLGGAGTAGLLPVFMQFTDGVNFLAAGIGQEVQTRLTQAGGNGPGSDVTIRAEVLKCVYDAFALEAGFSFTFEAQLAVVETFADRVTHAILAAKSGLFAVEAKIFIDCTGDGDLAACRRTRAALPHIPKTIARTHFPKRTPQKTPPKTYAKELDSRRRA